MEEANILLLFFANQVKKGDWKMVRGIERVYGKNREEYVWDKDKVQEDGRWRQAKRRKNTLK